LIIEGAATDLGAVARRIGWDLRPEGLCRGDVCVPLPDRSTIRAFAHALRRPLVEAPEQGLMALGPEVGRVLTSARAPEVTLPDWRGHEFSLSTLLGQKVLVVAWAPW
jgi:hypothetical protein